MARNVNDIIKKLSAPLRRKVSARADQFIDEETTLRKIGKSAQIDATESLEAPSEKQRPARS